MCGIAGIHLVPGAAERDDDVRRMAERLHHRGPDDSGWFSDRAAGVTLAQKRLAILDLSDRGHQPMKSVVVLNFNGEIYNYRSLRAELEAKGHRFDSTGDTVVLLRAWEEWGPACLDRLCGMFAISLWDPRLGTLYLARDPLGMKPLYYTELPGGAGIAFASEAKALAACSGISLAADRESIEQFMSFGYIWRESHTSFEGIRKLPPGHLLTVRAGRASEPQRWFHHPRPDEPGATSDELAPTLATVVREHLLADVPVGLLLSGGLDSSVVAALAARDQKITTFTMSFASSAIDETRFARMVSRHIGSDHHEVVIAPEDVFGEIEDAVDSVDDLFGDWGVVTTRLMYRRAREAGLKVVLVGEGSDEIFGGYPQYAAARAMGKGDLVAIAKLFRRYVGRRWASGFAAFRKRMREHLQAAGGDLYGAVRLFETVDQLPNNYVMKVDKASMSVSIEARAPYLDRRIAALGFSWRPIDGGPEKAILRQVAARDGLLPSEIVDRPKMGASIAASWMDDSPSFRAFARELVLDRRGWTDALGLRRAMEDFFDRGCVGYRFPHPISILRNVAWRLLMLNAWNRSFIGAPPS